VRGRYFCFGSLKKKAPSRSAVGNYSLRQHVALNQPTTRRPTTLTTEGSCYFCVSGSLGKPQTVTSVPATFFGVAGHRNDSSSAAVDAALSKPCVPTVCQSMPCQIVARTCHFRLKALRLRPGALVVVKSAHTIDIASTFFEGFNLAHVLFEADISRDVLDPYWRVQPCLLQRSSGRCRDFQRSQKRF
jgi:hypothetical protein